MTESTGTVSNASARKRGHHPYTWIPTLYFAEGLPAAAATEVSLIFFNDFGMSDARIAFWTNFLGLVPLLFVKLLWSPVVDAFSTRRRWIVAMQGIMELLLTGAAFVCGSTASIPLLLLILFAVSFFSASHDVAADGFYLLALSSHDQALYSGVRSVFFRVAAITVSGGLVMLAGLLSDPRAEAAPIMGKGPAWAWSLAAAALLLGLTALWHGAVLPAPETDHAKTLDARTFFTGFARVFVTFFQKKHVGTVLLFLLFYRLGEAQLGTVSKLFLLGSDGLAVPKLEYGFLVGTLGVCMMLAGGVAAGVLTARFGMGRLLWPMALAINVPDVLYVLLALLRHTNMILVGTCVSLEQFGYGFGFAGYMMFMLWFASTSPDDCKTSHFALMTVFMIAGLRIPSMPSGWIADHLTQWLPCGADRYTLFFLWVLVCTIPGYWVTHLAKKISDPDYGLKTK